MPRPVKVKGLAATSERLLDAAEIEFGSVGFSGAKLADIAKRVDIRRSSLLYHYATKEKLYEETIERAFSELGKALSSAMTASASFEERIEGITKEAVHFLDSRPHLARLITRELLSGKGPGWEILRTRVVPLIESVEHFIKDQGQALIRPNIPLRAAMMQVISSILLGSSAGELREALWGPGDHNWALAKTLFFKT